MHEEYTLRRTWVPGQQSWGWCTHAEIPQDVVGEFFVSPQRFKDQTSKDHWSHLFLDIDDKQWTGQGIEEARKCHKYLLRHGLDEEDLRWVFSGGGGFHCYASGYAIGVEPGNPTAIFKTMVATMIVQLGLECMDLKVYTVPRVMRLPGSTHKKTGLKCREISSEELMGKSLEEMRHEQGIRKES